jgi:hypothetical protein
MPQMRHPTKPPARASSRTDERLQKQIRFCRICHACEQMKPIWGITITELIQWLTTKSRFGFSELVQTGDEKDVRKLLTPDATVVMLPCLPSANGWHLRKPRNSLNS